jgi:hypothetical protein
MTDLLRRAWDTLDAFKQAYPENWHDEDEQVLKDLMSADFAAPQPEPNDYERGFIDGMSKQMQSSVDKAVNRLAALVAAAERERVIKAVSAAICARGEV